MFPFEEPHAVDALGWLGDFLSDRSRWLSWTPAVSDFEGCTRLASGVPVSPKIALMHSDCPTLALLDALSHAGYQPHAGRVSHSDATPPIFDNRSS